MVSDPFAVSCERVVRTYRTPTGEVRALRGVSARFPRGAVTAVVGPSGSGKSSLLRLIAGLDRPTSGALSVEGRDVGGGSAASVRRIRRELVGYVYQRPSDNFLPHLTVGEHLRSAARRGASPSFDAVDLLERLELDHRVDHLPGELSGGEQQRAAFAQTLASGARIVVADEPTAELDEASGEDVIARVRDLSEEGVTFVLATHDQAVVDVADAQVVLEHGIVQGDEAPAPSAHDPAAVHPLRWPDARVPSSVVQDEAVLRLSRVEKTYGSGPGSVHALRGVDLHVEPGMIVALIGRSGSGKTTLLNVAAGWERPDAGAVEAPGGEAPGWADVAVLPQSLGLMEELSVLENVEYPARIAGRLEERLDLVDDLIERLGLSGLRTRYPRETSLGEQQRAALARAIVLQPRLLLADEPTGHQDAGWAARVVQVLGEAASAGCCCVIATHDAALAPYLDGVIPMSDGAIELD
jgi:ABC-type lipoprotein export system ATPase subunit